VADLLIISPTRAESGCLESVIAALPEARVLTDNPGKSLQPDMSHANCITEYSGIFEHEKPKLVILLGDRYETHAAALAAHFLRIPIAHIHGGETTTGAFDDALRHGISHMAKLHFVATDDAARRVAELRGTLWHDRDGDAHVDDASISIVGAPGLDTIAQGSAKRDKKLIVVSWHPETCAPNNGYNSFCAMWTALLPYVKTHAIFFSTVNTDPGSAEVVKLIQDTIDEWPQACSWISPATREQYLHLLEHARVVVGNSSSIVIEAPWMGCPGVLVGSRQSGRPTPLMAVWQDDNDIGSAIDVAMDCVTPFEPIYRGGAAEKIAKICRNFLSGV